MLIGDEKLMAKILAWMLREAIFDIQDFSTTALCKT
jgi:hypothetical protein